MVVIRNNPEEARHNLDIAPEIRLMMDFRSGRQESPQENPGKSGYELKTIWDITSKYWIFMGQLSTDLDMAVQRHQLVDLEGLIQSTGK